MSDLYWLTDEQMARLAPYFPKSHGKPRVDDRRVLSGIIFVNRNGLRWRDAPREYGPSKTLYMSCAELARHRTSSASGPEGKNRSEDLAFQGRRPFGYRY
ncbi:transposase [Xanthobacter sp. V4C-4]|uniref:transposase n=1 Tax=Xanthobacter cornucopiae TaxID=3119924 RepID=UPI00372BA92A